MNGFNRSANAGGTNGRYRVCLSIRGAERMPPLTTSRCVDALRWSKAIAPKPGGAGRAALWGLMKLPHSVGHATYRGIVLSLSLPIVEQNKIRIWWVSAFWLTLQVE